MTVGARHVLSLACTYQRLENVMTDILCVSHLPSFVVLGDNERDLHQLQNIFLTEATLVGFTNANALLE